MPRRAQLPTQLIGAALRVDATLLAEVSRSRLRGSDVDAPFHGVRSVGLDISSVVGRCAAYLPLLTEGHVFCGVTAAILLRMPLPLRLVTPAVLHIGALAGAHPRRAAGVRGHRLPRGVELWRVGQFRVTSPLSTWCQLANVLGQEDLTAVGDALVSGVQVGGVKYRALVSLEQLRDVESSATGGRGAPSLRWAGKRVREGVDSRPETLLRLLLIAAGFDEPVIAPPIVVANGTLTLHPDLAWLALRIVLEYEGDGHRESKKQFREDIRRRELFEAADWHVIRVTADDLDSLRADFVARVRSIVAARVQKRP